MHAQLQANSVFHDKVLVIIDILVADFIWWNHRILSALSSIFERKKLKKGKNTHKCFVRNVCRLCLDFGWGSKLNLLGWQNFCLQSAKCALWMLLPKSRKRIP
jgi:hypothetical protein